jgi:hypothetical protein
MQIIDSPPQVATTFKDRGRPNKYPFSELLPGKSLIIEGAITDDYNRVKSALYQYKKNNNLDWVTSVRIDGNNIYVNRLS